MDKHDKGNEDDCRLSVENRLQVRAQIRSKRNFIL